MLRTDMSRDNSLVAEVRRAKFITPWWLSIPFGAALLPVVAAVLAPLAAVPIYGVLSALLTEPALKTYFSSIITILAFAFAALLLFLWVRLVERRPFHTIGFHARGALIGIPLGIGLALMFTALVMGGLSATGMMVPAAPDGTVPLGAAAMQGVGIAALMYAVQASTEEMIYRGWLQNVIAVRIGPPIAIAIVTIAFTWAHSRNDGFGLLPGINLVLFAVFLSLLALRTGSIWASCAWHAMWNWSLSNVWGVPLSGIPPEGGSVMTWTLTGPAVLTGGAWGPEGGLFATAVLTGGTVWAALWAGLGTRPATATPAVSHDARLSAYRAPHRR